MRTYKDDMTMRYPATRWQDALPVGSGVVGALVYGQIKHDIILLNHDALFYPREKAESIDVSDRLPGVRRLIQAGKCKEAATLMSNVYAERTGAGAGCTSTRRAPYQPFCSINLDMVTDGPFRKYRRGVDFSTGLAWVEWTNDTATFTREVFVSRVTDTVFLRIRSSKPGAVTCRLSLQKSKVEQKEKSGLTNAIPDDIALSASQHASETEKSITFLAEYPGAFQFGAVGCVEATGGKINVADDILVVEGVDELVLRVRLFLDEDSATAVKSLMAALTEQKAGFDTAFAEHSALHSELFNRVTLAIGQGEPLSNEELLMDAYDGEVPPSLIQKMFAFGRYLLICSSRPGGLPANLQGIWNGDYAPAWNSDVHTDENIQMNYWQALPGGIAESALPLFDYFEKYLGDFRENARTIFGCRGILVPIAMTTHGREIPCSWSNWTAAAGWIGQHFYDYYLFTGDLEFLRLRAVPWLKEVAHFYEDFLVKGEDGRLLFSPSVSPENRPENGNSLITMNATMDVAVCREVLTSLCDACQLLSIERYGVDRWRAMLAKLPDYEINEDGAFKEWLHPAFKDNYHHRHQSHLYPVFPGLEITAETHPDLFEACRVAVEKRLVVGLTSQTGWSMAHMANIYARLGMGDRALECMEILTRSSVGPNLFTYHNDWRKMGLSMAGFSESAPPFQIDANLGMTAAVLEMLVFSKPGLLKLHPALPGKWKAGRMTGIACRGGVTVGMEWNTAEKSFTATILSRSDQKVLLRLPPWAENITFEPASIASPSATYGPGYWDVTLRVGVALQLASS